MGKINRRNFFKTGAAGAGAALSMGAPAMPQGRDDRVVRLGFIGVGGQGTNLLRTSLVNKDVQVSAVCDIDKTVLTRAQDLVEKSGRPRPAAYGDGEEAFRKLVQRNDLDGVIIATPWEWHAAQAVATMKAGKYACVEVPVCTTVEECWDLVNTSEQTGMPLMMMENHCYQDDNLAVLKMVREGLFGELTHGECGYQHDVRYTKIDRQSGNLLWRGRHSVVRNGDLYPTHGLGPVAEFVDINCGNRFLYLTSTSSKSVGIKYYAAKLFGPDHPNARRDYALGDITTSVIKTARGETIIINHDTNTFRPYSNMTCIQGTKGIYKEFSRTQKYVHFEPADPRKADTMADKWEDFTPYMEKHRHKLWRDFQKDAAGFGHGGTDWIKVRAFLDCVKNRTPAPIDVYDAVAWSVVSPLSEASVAMGSAPQMFPDFTRGRWVNRKPFFGFET